MRKTAFIATLLITLVSCGPHRLRCGPGKRCVEAAKKANSNNPELIQKKTNS